MKQLLILSGKGGTGKTTVASALIKLLGAKAYADCDVDAPNLHLLFSKDKEVMESSYYAMPTAHVNADKCIGCGECEAHCKFGAITLVNGVANVDKHGCEGCKVCEYVCPADAIEMRHLEAGKLMLYKGKDETFSSARLNMGSGTSGKLVTEVKKALRENSIGTNLAIIDGSPGIGCPVVASLSGVDMVLIVTEPSVSGYADMKRIIGTAQGFGTKIAVCINKYDLNADKTTEIEDYLRSNNIPVIGHIPYDSNAVKAINMGKCVTDINCRAGKALQEIASAVKPMLDI